MKNWQKRYPPYEGDLSYVYFAFSDADSGNAWKIMRILLKRGCRVWYTTGTAGNSGELLRRQDRACGAALTLLYLTAAAVKDEDTKSAVLVNQSRNKPILCLDADGIDRHLAMGLRESTPLLAMGTNLTALEDRLIRADGFTQDLLGEPVDLGHTSLLPKFTLLLTVLAAVLLAVSLWFQPTYHDTVQIADPVILEAARAAAGGGSLTEETIAEIKTIRLEGLPESWEDLARLPALQQIVLPQEVAMQAEGLPIQQYRIVLQGGAS